jgi:hypothetical protein
MLWDFKKNANKIFWRLSLRKTHQPTMYKNNIRDSSKSPVQFEPSLILYENNHNTF